MIKIINNIIEQTKLSEQQAWWLLEFITHKTRAELQFSLQTLTDDDKEKLDVYIKQIKNENKPLAYILGWIPFLNLTLKITPPTLIPRPETENWVYELIEKIATIKNKNLTILDIGTGSGCIALSLAQRFPKAQIYAIDISQSALQLAQENAQLNTISNITIFPSDLFLSIPTNLKFDLIVSNPPYIPPTAELEKSVFNWEDHQALFAPNEGLQIIERIASQAKKYLKQNNELPYQLIMEIDVSQGETVLQLFKKNNFEKIEIKKDQFARDRTIWVK